MVASELGSLVGLSGCFNILRGFQGLSAKLGFLRNGNLYLIKARLLQAANHRSVTLTEQEVDLVAISGR